MNNLIFIFYQLYLVVRSDDLELELRQGEHSNFCREHFLETRFIKTYFIKLELPLVDNYLRCVYGE